MDCCLCLTCLAADCLDSLSRLDSAAIMAALSAANFTSKLPRLDRRLAQASFIALAWPFKAFASHRLASGA